MKKIIILLFNLFISTNLLACGFGSDDIYYTNYVDILRAQNRHNI